MIDGLAAVTSGVNHGTITLRESPGAGDFSGGPHQMTNQRTVLFVDVGNRRNVLAGDDQNVHGRLRVNIRERITLIILVNSFRWNASINDAAKKTTHGSLTGKSNA